MNICLKICDLVMRLSTERGYIYNHEYCDPFRIKYGPETDLDISVAMKVTDKLRVLPVKYLKINTTAFWFDEAEKRHIQIDIAKLTEDKKKCQAWMSASADWTDIEIHSDETPIPKFLEDNYLISAFSSRLAYLSGVIIHGSVVEHDGKGIIFTASSGVGKSTHAALWAENFGDKIINGDKAILRVIEGRVFVYGSPWSGSSPYVVNRCIPLAAIVALEQAKENTIRKLRVLESLQYFATHCYLPVWSGELTALAMKTLDEVLHKTPVWLLKNRPEKAAAVLVKDTIFE